MKSIMPDRSDPRIFSRQKFLQLLTASFDCGSYRFARQAALSWLAVFPGDLTVQYLLARAHLAENKLAQGIAILEKIVLIDPEFQFSQETLAEALHKIQSDKAAVPEVSISILTGKDYDNAPDWLADFHAARQLFEDGSQEEAEKLLEAVFLKRPDFVLGAVDYLKLAWNKLERDALHLLTARYQTRWPDCIYFLLKMAELEIEFGNEVKAVELLHMTVANDATGQVAQRMWGKDHRYQPLWPQSLEVFLDLAVPSEVAIEMGWNRLQPGQQLGQQPGQEDGKVNTAEQGLEAELEQPGRLSGTNQDETGGSESRQHQEKLTDDEVLRSVEESFAKLAKKVKKSSLSRSDGRYPVFVVLSMLKGLDGQYGPQTREIILKEIQQIVAGASKRPGWNALLYIPDDAEKMKGMNIAPVEDLDPWKIKLALVDLDQVLAKKGQMIGAVLIIGGDEVVPFHRLPNPTDDTDIDIPSDNPYATLDSNYFVPEWPVGRVPGEAGNDAGYLLDQLRMLNGSMAKQKKSAPQWGNIIRWLLDFLKQRAVARTSKGFGYTAAVWKESSMVVHSVINEAVGSIKMSPPETFQSITTEQLLNTNLAYFNLHGLADAAEWYGQKDAGDSSNTPDYPVALSPKNLVRNGRSPQIVFSEACYGAMIESKKEDDALSLKFLSMGVKAFIGSTTIAYGSVSKPLIGADLLGYHFWKYIKEGVSAGNALLQAKAALVKEMNQRQGFLDGEDQKTLISFVLYGDPLAGYEINAPRVRVITRFKAHPKIKMVCDRQTGQCTSGEISPEVLSHIKAVVEIYLPGLDDADIMVSDVHDICGEEKNIQKTSGNGDPSKPASRKAAKVVTVSKSFTVAKRTFHQFARVTLNDKGKMIKLAVSR